MYIAVYDVSGAASDRNCVVLSDIHIDIMDYIQPATCTDAEFRQMWAEFEWENKVSPWEISLNSLSSFLASVEEFSDKSSPTKKSVRRKKQSINSYSCQLALTRNYASSLVSCCKLMRVAVV